MRHLRSFTALFAAMSLGSCMMQSQTAPNEMGPSGFGWALTMTASPDVLPKDGSAQSIIRVNFRDGSTNAGIGQKHIAVGTTSGTLSVAEVVTDASGNASFVLTAPGLNTPGAVASVTALPVGSNVDNTVPQLIRIGLIGPDIPVPSFTFAPSSPGVGTIVTFDATGSTLAGSACGGACGYVWDFGGGSGGTGQLVQHTFTTSGVKSIVLTVTGPGGTSGSTTQSFVIAAPPAPTAAFSVTPTTPTVNVQAIFNGISSTVGAGGTITQYVWDFGDGTTATSTGPIVPKTYGMVGTYAATLTVTDNLGRTASVITTVTVVP